MIVLHIGLPKTGTTFLQHSIFRRTPGIRFLHRRKRGEGARICGELRSLTRADEPEVAARASALAERLRVLHAEAPAPLLVSDEKISVDAAGFWNGVGVGPAMLARRVGALQRCLAPDVPLRVVIGVRRQDRWLASRYAESSKAFPGFDQADFDRRMAAFGDLADLRGPFAWLDFDAVRGHFESALGREGVLLISMERLMRDPRSVLREIGGFMGDVDFLPAFDAIADDREKLIRNRLSVGRDEWVMRRDRTRLRLDDVSKQRVLERFADSNRSLGGSVPLGFED